MGTSSSQYEGTIYVPSTELDYAGTSTATNWTVLIGDRISVTGTARVNGDYSASSIVPPTLKAILVE